MEWGVSEKGLVTQIRIAAPPQEGLGGSWCLLRWDQGCPNFFPWDGQNWNLQSTKTYCIVKKQDYLHWLCYSLHIKGTLTKRHAVKRTKSTNICNPRTNQKNTGNISGNTGSTWAPGSGCSRHKDWGEKPPAKIHGNNQLIEHRNQEITKTIIQTSTDRLPVCVTRLAMLRLWNTINNKGLRVFKRHFHTMKINII